MRAAAVDPSDVLDLVATLGAALALEDLQYDPLARAPSELTWGEFLALQQPRARDRFEQAYARQLEQSRPSGE
jgi:hypothetical protein